MSSVLKRIYQHTEVLVLNREEAVLVSGGNHDDLHDLFNRLHSYGPKIVVITDDQMAPMPVMVRIALRCHSTQIQPHRLSEQGQAMLLPAPSAQL